MILFFHSKAQIEVPIAIEVFNHFAGKSALLQETIKGTTMSIHCDMLNL